MTSRSISPALVLALAGAGLVSPVAAQQHTPLADPIPGQIPQSSLRINLETVQTGLVSPNAAAVAPGDHSHLYVADQSGQVWRIATSNRDEGDDEDDEDEGPGGLRPPELFLDVSKLLVTLGLGPGKYDERGLLGIAFHPQFRFNGLFYTFTSQPAAS